MRSHDFWQLSFLFLIYLIWVTAQVSDVFLRQSVQVQTACGLPWRRHVLRSTVLPGTIRQWHSFIFGSHEMKAVPQMIISVEAELSGVNDACSFDIAVNQSRKYGDLQLKCHRHASVSICSQLPRDRNVCFHFEAAPVDKTGWSWDNAVGCDRQIRTCRDCPARLCV